MVFPETTAAIVVICTAFWVGQAIVWIFTWWVWTLMLTAFKGRGW